ncbi:MAG: hypothetical protein A3J29_10995 [Acidobacteria bacterium RIFCSPLOWO2_12_FULL_67_14b]|nr:MAG: hypothetical protein A3J29_10995 [Acidobacteria bacterium RIFCSPLOWO2_12_FULL_67_14b]
MRLAQMLAGCAVVISTALPAFAQTPSLGDLAKRVEADRATARRASKAYTNADLIADPDAAAVPAPPSPSDAPATGAYMSISAGRMLSAEEIIARSEARIAANRQHMDEGYWRLSAASLRSQLERAKTEVDLLSTPVERSPQQQALTDKALARAQKVLADLQERWRKFEDSAHYATVPKAWLEPQE